MSYSNMENANDPDMDNEGRDGPWATPVGDSDSKSVPYRVRRITSDVGENDLNFFLAGLLNTMATENYHPIRFHSHEIKGTSISNNYIYAYTVIFYYMPNGPAFTPPF